MKILISLGQLIGTIQRGFAYLLTIALMAVILTVFYQLLIGLLVQKPQWLIYRPSSLAERPSELSLNGLANGNVSPELGFAAILESIRAAGVDANIKGLILETADLQPNSFAQLQELRRVIADFRRHGKPVFAWATTYAQEQYFLASAADKVFVAPYGEVFLSGFGSRQLYYHDALERIGINANVLRHGRYKSAVEPYMQNHMSDDDRMVRGDLLNGAWQTLVTDIAASRHLTAEQINAYQAAQRQKTSSLAEQAKKSGFVDNLMDRNDWRNFLMATIYPDAAVRAQKAKPDNNEPELQSLSEYYQVKVEPALAKNDKRIAVLVAEGIIGPGQSAEAYLGGDSLSNEIRTLEKDDRVAAMVLRINSPGGGVDASQQIREALQSFHASGKPIVVSMGGVAASGGYWIATAADRIIAESRTITGSIGVFGVLPEASQLLNRVGIAADGVATSDYRKGPDLFTPLTSSMQELMQNYIANTYQRFIKLVADARHLDPAKVDEIAQGRVWSGEEALKIGLVDELGGVDTALASAAKLAGLTEKSQWSPLYYAQNIEGWQGVLQNLLLSSSVLTWFGPLLSAVQLFAEQAARLLLLSRMLTIGTSGAIFADCECSAL